MILAFNHNGQMLTSLSDIEKENALYLYVDNEKDADNLNNMFEEDIIEYEYGDKLYTYNFSTFTFQCYCKRPSASLKMYSDIIEEIIINRSILHEYDLSKLLIIVEDED